jgi:glutamate-1-semialdehyde 2,1-aminomutase
VATNIADVVVRGPDSLRRSEAEYEWAKRVMPRGVTNAGRAFRSPFPLSFERGLGSRVWDLDGNEYIDYDIGTSVTVLGHCPPRVVARVREQLERGLHLTGHHGEVELAERVCRLVPSIDRVMFLQSGSEADHAAIGLARGVTGRRKIAKFGGHNNGWIWPMRVALTGNPNATYAKGASAVPSDEVVICTWKDGPDLERVFAEHGAELAAIILDPLGSQLPVDVGFLQRIRELCDQHGVLMIFDEVVAAFRVALGGAQERFGVLPDVTTFAKGVASGLPISGLGATAEVWERSYDAGVMLVGTYNGNAVAVAGANGCLELLEDEADEIYPRMEVVSGTLAEGVRSIAAQVGAPVTVNQLGPCMVLYWGLDEAPDTFEEAARSDLRPFPVLEAELIRRGVYTLGGSRWYLSLVHDLDDVEQTLVALGPALEATMAATS